MAAMQMILPSSQRNGGCYSEVSVKMLVHLGCTSGSMTSSASPVPTCKPASSHNTPPLLDNPSNVSHATWQMQACWNARRLAHHLLHSSCQSMSKANPLESLSQSHYRIEVLHGRGLALTAP